MTSAHHPTAIAQTLMALRARYADGSWGHPRTAINTLRRRVFQKELAQSLSIADQVVIARSSNQRRFLKTSASTRQY